MTLKDWPGERGYTRDTGWATIQEHVPTSGRVGTDAISTPAEQAWGWRDAEIHLDRYGPDDAPATLLVLHGAGGNGRLAGPCAVAAARAGFAAVCPDLPGYGLSRSVDRNALRFTDWIDCATDLLTSLRAAGPVVVLGLSIGGTVAYDAVARAGAAALIATCLLDPRDPQVRRGIVRWRWTAPVVERLLPHLGRADRVPVPVRWIARMKAIANDPAVAARITSDPLTGGTAMPVGWMRSLLAWVPAVEPEAFDACPVVLAHPAADRWTPIELSLRFLHRVPAERRSVVLLERAGHFPLEQPGFDQFCAVIVAQLRAADDAGR